MTSPRRLLAAFACLALLTAGLGPLATADAAPPGSRSLAVARGVLHRVVWYDDSTKGIHLRSAEHDGSDERDIYDRPDGFTLQLSLDRAGRRVAFSTCCRDSIPALVVVPVLGGRALTPLAHHRKIYDVGGIGWSPDGSRLVFEGSVRTKHTVVTSLWTIRPDGRDLRHLMTLPARSDPDQVVINDALAWTRAGILYSDGRNLRAESHGRSHVVLRHAFSARISGNGRFLVIPHAEHGHSDFVECRTDVTHCRLVARDGVAGRSTTYYDVQPDDSGRHVIATREVPGSLLAEVTWTVGRSPSTAAVRSDAGIDATATWN